MKSKALLSIAVVFLLAFASFAGTLFFKDGKKLSDVKIVSINKGRITIEKDKTKKSYSLKSIVSYFDSDIGEGSSSEMNNDDFIDYKVSMEVDMPKKGTTRSGKKQNCEIKYSIRRIFDKGKGKNKKDYNKVKHPYFYLFVLTNSADQSGTREIIMYYYPKEAKYKSKGYDQAAIISNLSKFDRDIIHFGQDYGLDTKKSIGQREIKIPLKKLKNRNVIAYHVEVWGNKGIIAEKNWSLSGAKAAKRWWERY